MQQTTTYENDKYNGWTATTNVVLGEVAGGQRLLVVTTSKYGQKVRTAARALIERGSCREYGLCSDFHKEMGLVIVTRGTEKAIRQAHEIALTGLAQVIDQAKAHYAQPLAA